MSEDEVKKTGGQVDGTLLMLRASGRGLIPTLWYVKIKTSVTWSDFYNVREIWAFLGFDYVADYWLLDHFFHICSLSYHQLLK